MTTGEADRPLDLDQELTALRERHHVERAKRLREQGASQYVRLARRAAGDPRGLEADPYVEPGFTRPPLADHTEVVIIGAGLAALVAGATLRRSGLFKPDDIRLIDAAGDVGGAWYWNRYPGVMCDIESYIYLPLLEEMEYVPTHRYSSGREIRAYASAIAERFGLYAKACFQTAVTGLTWRESERRWCIETDRGDAMTASYVIIAGGPLNVPKLPGIPGIENLAEFEGRVFHTSRWDYGYTGGDEDGDLTGLIGQRVGIVGTGATALQAVPHLGRWAEQLYVFQRTPSTVDIRGNHATDPAFAASLRPGWQRERMENFSRVVHGGSVDVDLVDDSWTQGYRHLFGSDVEPLPPTASPAERMRALEIADMESMRRLRARIDEVVEDPATAAALKPWYGWMCKRPGFHDDYLPTFNRPNVTLVDTNGRGLDRITRTGVVANDVSYDLDCLVFATGFETASGYTTRIGYDLVGRDGVQLSEAWADGMRTLHGLAAHR
ncbi:MAG: Baeyer-Villiger monooxygenase, partial [Acidimicrobiia bacterium]|nr:Baeyer-Villiger monooxygenase [Acidimicrobiia bacterium]